MGRDVTGTGATGAPRELSPYIVRYFLIIAISSGNIASHVTSATLLLESVPRSMKLELFDWCKSLRSEGG